MKNAMRSTVLLIMVLVGSAGCADVAAGLGVSLATQIVGGALIRGIQGAPPAPPLPADVNVVAPGSDIPADLAAFSGAWLGEWSPRWAHLFVVEEFLSPEKARVVFSNGGSSFPKEEGKWVRRTARFKNGGLVFKRKGIGDIVYRLNPDGTLAVEASEPEMKVNITLRRADLAEFRKEANAKE